MAAADVRMALVEGEDGDGVIVEEDSFDLDRNPVTSSASDQVVAAILGTREGAADAGLRLSSIGVTWTDPVQAAALRDALAWHKVENVMLVSGFLAAAALGQAVGGALSYARTAVLFIEPDTATLAVVDTADGSVSEVCQQLLAEDDDAAVAEVVAMVAAAESLPARPDGVYVVGTGVDVAMIKPALDAATSLTVSVSEEQEWRSPGARRWPAAMRPCLPRPPPPWHMRKTSMILTRWGRATWATSSRPTRNPPDADPGF